MQEAIKILILSANPRGTSQLRLDEEIREIREGLKRSKYREQFSLETSEAVRYRDIHRAILDSEPSIIHFSGHGAGEEGLVFEDDNGQVKLIDTEALEGLFKLFAEQLKCVILNACYSQRQAEAIAQYIPYVIGMKKAIGDRAAIEFAVGFYDAIGAGKTVEFAKKLGCNAIRTAGIAESLIPVLIKKPDIEETAIEINNEYNQEKKYEMTFVFSGTLTEDNEVEFNGKKTKIKALLQHLEKFCDGELTIYDISHGSVRLRLGGSPEDLEKLQELFRSGKLNEVLGIPIKDVQLMATETTVNNEKIDTEQKFSLAKEINSKSDRGRNTPSINLITKDTIPVSNNNRNNNEAGKKIKSLCRKYGFKTDAELALISGISKSYISKLFTGIIHKPGLEKTKLLLKALSEKSEISIDIVWQEILEIYQQSHFPFDENQISLVNQFCTQFLDCHPD